MAASKILTTGAKLLRKVYDSIDDKATNIPGRKTDSISVGKERQKRAERKKKGTEAIAGGAIVEALGIPAETLKQEYAGSDSMGKTMSTRRMDTIRDIKGTPAETPEKISEKTYKRKPTKTEEKEAREGKLKRGGKVKKYAKGGKIGRGCGAAMRGGGKVMR